ncbi:hypothetical protein GGR26_000840 [Lewinella marina]|uniref:DUF4249 domain-containing protein n=1 Tax=Neolewinella marina TaxID=438751 RepID=A0A2G0CIG8_9BACT|nr:DUF4249 family protein [Neolewinella marina]NJB85095.1 hypothetical protein [Neolewinella marina]PHK99766.1 hypothetical protein CGL56_01575 [Neolewinella marina]
MRLLLLFLPLLLVSCRNDFSLQADLADVPVVYGFLDAAGEVHFVRVERAVPDADVAAADPGQLYYGPDAATVSLTNLGTGVTVEMDRVNGNALDLPRATGPFATTPNILYRVSDEELRLQAGQSVEVRVARPDADDALATTRLLEPLRILRPSTTARLDDYRRPVIVSWNAPPEATVFAVQLLFSVDEHYVGDPSRDRTVELVYDATTDYRPGGAGRSGELVSLELDNEAVYRFLGASFEPTTGVSRQLTAFDLRVTAVGPELGTLLTLSDANAGLTGAQARPRYSNVVKGEGVVSSRTTDRRPGIQLDAASLDSLREGRHTRALNFR